LLVSTVVREIRSLGSRVGRQRDRTEEGRRLATLEVDSPSSGSFLLFSQQEAAPT
jgi:hypothetical protein